jgi:hypothetical protein
MNFLKEKPGRPGEERTILFRCGPTGKRFAVVFARIVGTFKVARVDDLQIPALAGPREDSSFAIGEFDFYGWRCPWCGHPRHGDTGLFVRCGKCREYVCRGRSSKDFLCHAGCGSRGPVTGDIRQMEASSGESAPLTRRVLPSQASSANVVRRGSRGAGRVISR